MTGILRAGLTLLLLTTLVACGAGSTGPVLFQNSA